MLGQWLISAVVMALAFVQIAGNFAQPLLTYVHSNRSPIVNCDARYRSSRRIASSLAESAIDSPVARRMVKKQQMQWRLKGAHGMLQVRSAVFNGDLRERLTWQPLKPTHRYRLAWMFAVRANTAIVKNRMKPSKFKGPGGIGPTRDARAEPACF